MIRISKADAKRAGLVGKIAFPKPKARCKHRWRAVVVKIGDELMPGNRCCAVGGCGGLKPMKVRRPLRKLSPKARRKVLGWPELRRRVFDLVGGVCFWHGGSCAFESGTVEHADPSGPESESNYNWVCHVPFLGSCHDRKGRAGIRGIVAAQEMALTRYDREIREWIRTTRGENPTAVGIASALKIAHPDTLKVRRMELRHIQIRVARFIGEGVIESRLRP